MDGETALLAEIQLLEERRAALAVAGDLDGLAPLLSETLIYGHSSGAKDSKDSLLATLRSGVVRYQAIIPELDAAVDLGNGLAIVSGWLTTRVEVGGQPRELSGRYMAVWRRRDSGWTLESLQGSNK